VVAVEKPAVAVLGLAEQHVEFVVAEHALRPARLHPVHHPVEHRRAVGAAIAQVAHEHGATTRRVAALRRVAQVPEQGQQGIDLAVNVADHVERTIEQTRLGAV
jgi:hypothetical protein